MWNAFLSYLNPMVAANKLTEVAGLPAQAAVPVIPDAAAPAVQVVADPVSPTAPVVPAMPEAAPASQVAPSTGFIAASARTIAEHPIAVTAGIAVGAAAASALIMSRSSKLDLQKEFAKTYRHLASNERALASLAKLHAAKDKAIIDILKSDEFIAIVFADLKDRQLDAFDGKDAAGKKAYIDAFNTLVGTVRNDNNAILAMQEGRATDFLKLLNPQRIANELFGGEQAPAQPAVPVAPEQPAAPVAPVEPVAPPAPAHKLNAVVYEQIDLLAENKGHRALAKKRAAEIENGTWKVDSKVLDAFNKSPEKAAQLFAQNDAVLKLFKAAPADKQVAKLNAARQAEIIPVEKKAAAAKPR